MTDKSNAEKVMDKVRAEPEWARAQLLELMLEGKVMKSQLDSCRAVIKGYEALTPTPAISRIAIAALKKALED